MSNADCAGRHRALILAAAGLAWAGSLALLAGPVPARAADGPPVVGCTTGSSCMVELNWDVSYSGAAGGHNGVVIPPPPCIGVPAGDAHTGSQAIISLYGNTAPVPGPSTAPPVPAAPSVPTAPSASTASAVSSASQSPTSAPPSAPATAPAAPGLSGSQQQILSQAQQLAASNPVTPGEWYQISGDPYASAAAQQKCTSLPPYVWVAGNGTLPALDGLRVPLKTLAKLAYSQLTTASLGQVTLDPQARSDTNLPTFVDVALRGPARGVLAVTAHGDPYVWATATTPDRQSATVWAWATGVTVSPGTANAVTYDQPRCSTAHLAADGHTFGLGSRYTPAEMAQVGAGAKIDCGVTYTKPGTYALTVSVTWNACWAKGPATAVGPPPGCKPVPGATALEPSVSAPVPVTVREIQSDNG
jgi:hypothetical protein